MRAGGWALVALAAAPAWTAGIGALAGQTRGNPSTPGASRRVRLVVAEGTEARYRVREQLAGIDLPSDAVGVTSEVEGAVVFDADGSVIPEESRFEVDLTSLVSDRDRRDNFLRRRILETEEHPTAVLVPTEMRGLPFPLPTSGEVSFQMVGDFTVHGGTRSSVWAVDATFDEAGVSGNATTTFTFDELGLEKPRVPLVLSVGDEIRLELDFRLAHDPSS